MGGTWNSVAGKGPASGTVHVGRHILTVVGQFVQLRRGAFSSKTVLPEVGGHGEGDIVKDLAC